MARSLCIRRILPQDIADVCEIDAECLASQPCWSREDFYRFLSREGSDGFAAAWEGRVIGYVIYQVSFLLESINLIRIGVGLRYRHRRVGSYLVDRVKKKAQSMPGTPIRALVHEEHLCLQLFLRANAFQAIRICSRFFDEESADAYLFEHWQ